MSSETRQQKRKRVKAERRRNQKGTHLTVPWGFTFSLMKGMRRAFARAK